ncbi:MAG: AAA family ATPase [Deltaproteobacteria bacterium]|nr:AAA family ATPase [Deltaproteobacteria bacterium]
MVRKPPVFPARFELSAARLRRTIDPRSIPYATTAGVQAGTPAAPAGGEPRHDASREMMVGQRRAVDALDFGLRVRARGFNIYVLGDPGSGKTTSAERMVEARAAEEPPGLDVIYVHDFDEPDHPRGIRLPAGRAAPFAHDVDAAITELGREIPRVLSTAAFRDQRHKILDASHQKAEARFVQLVRQGRRHRLLVRRDGDHLALTPLKGGTPLTTEQYDALPDEVRAAYESRSNAFQRRVPEYDRHLRQIQKELEAELLEAERAGIAHVVEVVFNELRRKHPELPPDAKRYVEQLRDYVLDNHRLFLPPEELPGAESREGAESGDEAGAGGGPQVQEHPPFRINVLVDRRRETRAPVVVERNPTYPNLLGYPEYRETRGIYSTDHTLIRPGALHRANGGYLILQIADLARSPNAWDALKKAIRHRELRIEELEDESKPKTTGSVRPTPIPLDVKVILVGSSETYWALQSQDDDFTRLFKVKADFEAAMPLSRGTLLAAVRFVARAAGEERLLPLDRGALAKVLEHGVRDAGDQKRLTTRLATLIDLAAEADHWARRARHKSISAADVDRALAERFRRHEKDEDAVLKEIRDGTILLDTRGAVIGQVNGLTVYDQGDHSFGVPARITARTYVGRKEVVNIDREVRLSGAIHDKGALTLVGFLGGRFARDKPLALSASITFEQNYGFVEGDSASAAELYALLSGLARVPIRQGIAVTGSVNQQGEIQPVGGVNEKIEGFFRVCRIKGLSGAEGVVIPRANVRHLMLAQDVVEAVRRRRFHIFAVGHVDEGIEILTGMPAGRRNRGRWQPHTLNDLIDRRLRELGEVLRLHENVAVPGSAR